MLPQGEALLKSFIFTHLPPVDKVGGVDQEQDGSLQGTSEQSPPSSSPPPPSPPGGNLDQVELHQGRVQHGNLQEASDQSSSSITTTWRGS